MDQATAPETTQAPRKRRVGHRRFWATLGLALFAIVLALAALGLSGRSIPLPGPVVAMIEDTANRALAGQARLRIGSGNLVVTSGFVPQVSLGDVTLISPGGQRLAGITDLRAALDGGALIRGQVLPSAIRVTGARIAVRRQPDGRLDIATGAGGFTGKALDPAELLDAVDAAFSAPTLAGLSSIRVEGLALLFDDQRARQVWTVRDGLLTIGQTAGALRADLRLDVSGQAGAGVAQAGNDRPQAARATAVLHLATDKTTSRAELAADLSGISARDLAAQVPALAWLGALDASLSGKLTSGFEPDGRLSPITVALTIGAGVLQPAPDAAPVPFETARLQMRFDPDAAALHIEDLSVRSAMLRAGLTGTAWLKDFDQGVPGTLIAQAHLSEFLADADGVFDAPVDFTSGALDFKLTLDPFEIKIGQFALTDGTSHLTATGKIAAGDAGWTAALDLGIDRMEARRLLALWPLQAVPRTREWLDANVIAGDLSGMKAALRLAQGQRPRWALDFGFKDADVRFMRTMPPITGGAGYASLYKDAFVLTTEAGRVMAPTGGAIDISGSVVAVPDINRKPAPLDITLKTASTIPAALSLLDLKPFGFLTRAGQPVDLAQGQARLLGRLQLTPKPRMRPEDVVFSLAGTLSDVTSDRIVKGRALSAASLTVEVDNKGIAIAGPARFAGIPVEGRWTQVFGPEGKGRSEVAGQIELSPATLKALSIQLPESALKGRGRGDFRIDLIRGQAPEFRLTSDLKGLLLSIPEVAWVKPEGTKGRFEVRGRLASPAQIDRITLGANGLEAAGGVRLKADGSLDVARFERVTLEDWFDGAVEITGRGKGQLAAVAITGGRADMRGATFGASEGASEGAGGGGRPPLTVALDGLRITQGIELGAFQGTFDGVAGGMQGQFTGLVNGAAPVAGAVGPDPNGGTAIRITSGDAGGTLAAAGIYASGRGGALDLSLRPLGDKGSYDGSIRINDIRIVNAPGLASLLNSVSVVGLIDELRGKGIVFGNAEGRFRLTPAGVEIAQGSAIGPSLGVSLAGVYYAGEERFDLQGVISPLYLLNGIGQIFSRQRDGLFGFNYRLTGTRNEYKVAVNPLSLLTPGMFREIFRRPPPKFTPQSGG